MQYILIQFTKGLDVQAYQEVDSTGTVTRYCDVDTGTTIDLPADVESYVLNAEPDKPSWAA